MSNTGRSDKRSRKAGSSKFSQDSLAVQSSHSYEGMPRNISTTSSRVTRNTDGYPNGSYGNITPSPALQDYLQRPQRDDPWAPENARHAYGQDPNDTYNGSHSYSSGSSRYNYPPANPQYNNPYSNPPMDDPYNPYSNSTVNNAHNNQYNSSHLPPCASRNGGIPSGGPNNSRFGNTNGSDYNTMYGRSNNLENNQNNTSNNQSRNPYSGSRR